LYDLQNIINGDVQKIIDELMAVRQQEMFQVVSRELVNNLRDEDGTEVTLYLQNLGWE